jgi:hypothetical protein
LELIKKQITEIENELKALIKEDEDAKNSVANMYHSRYWITNSSNGFRETNGFELIRNKRQLTSYAGLDVKEKQSGTSIKESPAYRKRQ